MKTPVVSVIIPVKEINDYLRKETIPALFGQSYKKLEIIILPNQPSGEKFPKTKIIATWPKIGPADKRDLGAKKAQGEILAFLDDDSYPVKNWLKNALAIFSSQSLVVAVCGPTLTPAEDNLYQKASGYVWSTWLGSGGAGTFRCSIASRREVDDYPTVNLLVRKKDFLAVGGFDSKFWPGEDTKLCHDLVYKLKKKIIYDPNVLVYHHRREVFGPHLKQISRYALHRGHFARILPKTSFRLGYFIPSFFVIGLLGGPIAILVLPFLLIPYLLICFFYLFLLLFVAVRVWSKEKDFQLAFLVIPSILLTHLIYGPLFIKGYLAPKLKEKYKK